VVRLIQKTLLQKSGQIHLAEVFLGGLLEPETEITPDNPDAVIFNFIEEEIRYKFLEVAPVSDSAQIVEAISADFAQRLGLTLNEFDAFLRLPGDKMVKGTSLKAFARVKAQILNRLGGKYARLAQELEEPVKNYAIAVGINCYITNWLNNQYAVKDAVDIHNWLSTAAGFDKVYLFTDPESSQLTREKLARFLDDTFKKPFLSAQDNLWFFFSGYGIHWENVDYLVLPTQIFGQVQDTAIPVSYVIEQLRRSGSGNIILFLDADRDLTAYTGQLRFIPNPQEELESTSSPTTIPDRGEIVFYSSRPGEAAYEIFDLQQGAFTSALLEALRHQKQWEAITVESLATHLRDRVPALNQQYRLPKQTPQMIAEPPSKSQLILLPTFRTSFCSIKDYELELYRDRHI
jgi:hypothetical protein